MTLAAERPAATSAEPERDLREQLSSLRGLLALSMIMTERRQVDEILHLATTVVPALVRAEPLGVHLPVGDGPRWHALRSSLEAPAARAEVLSQLQHLTGSGGSLLVPGHAWAWAFALPSPVDHIGWLIVAGDRPLGDDDMLLLRSLAQQTGIALSNARLHAAHRASNEALSDTVATLRRTTAIHDRFTRVALEGGGHQGIVDALFELTGLTASVEDAAGRVLASAGPVAPAPRRSGSSSRREALVRAASVSGHPVRADDRLVTVARPHPDVVGVLMLHDPEFAAGPAGEVALEHAATVLAIELARLHALAETELRLGRNIVADLLSGESDDAAERALSLGHDLGRTHRVVVIGVDTRYASADRVVLAVRDAVRAGTAQVDASAPPLLMQSGASLIAVLPARAVEGDLLAALQRSAGRGARIGVGGVSRGPDELARSHREAQVALRMAQSSRTGSTIARYEDLGVYQLLSESADPRTLDAFVTRWLAPVVQYDREHGSDLMITLAAYLDAGGNYDAAALSLTIGRSTVRYRVGRIAKITGLDLTDPDTRFHLQLATRAWATMQALGGA